MSVNLKNILGDKSLSLRSTSDKVGFTNEEKQYAAEVLSMLLPQVGVTIPKPMQVKPQTIELLGTLTIDNGDGVLGIAKAMLEAHAELVLKHNEEYPDKKIVGFPKVRDYTSRGIICRQACELLGITKEQAEQWFPKYKKKVA